VPRSDRRARTVARDGPRIAPFPNALKRNDRTRFVRPPTKTIVREQLFEAGERLATVLNRRFP